MLSPKNNLSDEEEKNFHNMVMDDVISKSLVQWLTRRKKEAEDLFIAASGNAVFNNDYRLPAARAKGKVDAISDILARIEKIRR